VEYVKKTLLPYIVTWTASLVTHQKEIQNKRHRYNLMKILYRHITYWNQMKNFWGQNNITEKAHTAPEDTAEGKEYHEGKCLYIQIRD